MSSTDHMFQQFGLECLGSCGKFTLKIIRDDPEKLEFQQSKRILRSRIASGTTYAYLEGCPSEKGCTIGQCVLYTSQSVEFDSLL